MTPRKLTIALAALSLTVLAAASAAPARAEEPTVWLRVEVNGMDDHAEHVKITVPLSLMEVVVDSVDPTNAIAELKSEKGIDLPKLWRQIRGMDIDEFITVDSDTAKVRVFKDSKNFRVTVHEEEEFGGDVEMRIPFQVMDFLFKDRKGEFRLSELVDQLRGDLPLTILEATKRDGGSVKVWLEEK